MIVEGADADAADDDCTDDTVLPRTSIAARLKLDRIVTLDLHPILDPTWPQIRPVVRSSRLKPKQLARLILDILDTFFHREVALVFSSILHHSSSTDHAPGAAHIDSPKTSIQPRLESPWPKIKDRHTLSRHRPIVPNQSEGGPVSIRSGLGLKLEVSRRIAQPVDLEFDLGAVGGDVPVDDSDAAAGGRDVGGADIGEGL